MSKSERNKKLKTSKNRKTKINLVFDDKKRREFLTGFHKRKLERKKKAKEEFEKKLKEERKRLKTEAKESYKKLVQSYKPIPDIEHLLEKEYEEDNVTVKILELSTQEIAKQQFWIGQNFTKYEKDEEEKESESENSDNEEVELPGMELQQKKIKKAPDEDIKPEFKSEKDIKLALKKQATKNVKKSKVFQKKDRMERNKQKKKALREKKYKSKFVKGKKEKKDNKKKTRGGR